MPQQTRIRAWDSRWTGNAPQSATELARAHGFETPEAYIRAAQGTGIQPLEIPVKTLLEHLPILGKITLRIELPGLEINRTGMIASPEPDPRMPEPYLHLAAGESDLYCWPDRMGAIWSLGKIQRNRLIPHLLVFDRAGELSMEFILRDKNKMPIFQELMRQYSQAVASPAPQAASANPRETLQRLAPENDADLRSLRVAFAEQGQQPYPTLLQGYNELNSPDLVSREDFLQPDTSLEWALFSPTSGLTGRGTVGKRKTAQACLQLATEKTCFTVQANAARRSYHWSNLGDLLAYAVPGTAGSAWFRNLAATTDAPSPEAAEPEVQQHLLTR